MSFYDGGTNPYRLEYAKSNASYCVGPCQSRIRKGVLRFGSPVMFGGDNPTYKWRHMSCITFQVLGNLQGKIGRHGLETALSGLQEIRPEDRERVMRMLGEEGLDAIASDDEEPEEAGSVKTPQKAAPARLAKEEEGVEAALGAPTGRPKRATAGKRKTWVDE